ncbi:hypothetical protein BD769DRAFT_1429450 [Suillus cothurnatus]|nr:hypothetical protein BD769DRAFT_1429450 [Suillus cothurnatus]
MLVSLVPTLNWRILMILPLTCPPRVISQRRTSGQLPKRTSSLMPSPSLTSIHCSYCTDSRCSRNMVQSSCRPKNTSVNEGCDDGFKRCPCVLFGANRPVS